MNLHQDFCHLNQLAHDDFEFSGENLFAFNYFILIVILILIRIAADGNEILKYILDQICLVGSVLPAVTLRNCKWRPLTRLRIATT